MSRNKLIGFAAAAIVAVSTAAAAHDERWIDNQYIDRSDSITPGVGGAVARNIAIQTVDPWPRYVNRRKIDIDADRINLAARRYKSNRVDPLTAPRIQTIIGIGGIVGN